MEIDIRLIIEIIGVAVLIAGAIQTYRKGTNDAMSSLVEMTSEQSEKNYKLLKECQEKTEKYRNDAAKWRDAFLLRGIRMKKSGVKSGKFTLQYITQSTYEQIHGDYIDESNI